MAIVDVKHTQTIEEAFSQVAEGGSGGALVVTISDTDDGKIMDKTWKEIHDAYMTGTVMCEYHMDNTPYDEEYEWYPVILMAYHHDMQYDDGDYYTLTVGNGNDTEYITRTESGYPQYHND